MASTRRDGERPHAEVRHAVSVTRYPLSWPTGWARTEARHRKRATFGTRRPGEWKKELSVLEATRRLSAELLRLGTPGNEILSTNLRTRMDGLPASGQVEPSDPGVAVYFDLAGVPTVFACDRWTRVADNIAAIAAHVEALRAVERYGVGTMDRAFAGYAALPPTHEDWWLVLGVRQDADPGTVKEAYRTLLMAHHPDRGGDPDLMSKINRAYQTYEAAQK